MPETVGPVLRTQELVSGYGRRRVLDGVSVEVRPGEIVAILGHNGAGKSTLLKTIIGVVSSWGGRVFVDEREISDVGPSTLLLRGVAYVPQGNRVFPELTVYENLEVRAAARPHVKTAELVGKLMSAFPMLVPHLRRRAATLSGGEKQMLALASVLILSPRVLLLDEPSLGLAPASATKALQFIQEIAHQGIAVLLVEQKVRAAVAMSARVYVLRNGKVSFEGASSTLVNEGKLREVYM